MQNRSITAIAVAACAFLLAFQVGAQATTTPPTNQPRFEREKTQTPSTASKVRQPRSLSPDEQSALDDAIDREVMRKLRAEAMPLKPMQIEELSKEATALQRAKGAGSRPTAQPVIRTLPVDLSSREAPPTINIEWGMSTNLAFFDWQGNPWPIVFARSGDADVAKVGPEVKKDDTAMKQRNIITLEVAKAEGRFRSTNLSVLLEGTKAPIVMHLVPNTARVDFRVDVVVASGSAPGSKATESMTSFDQTLHAIANGTFKGGKAVAVVGDPSKSVVSVMEVDSNIVVTTRGHSIVSPAPLAVTTTTDGRVVARLPKTTVISVSTPAGIEFVRFER